MSSIIRATTTSGLQVAPDNSGSLQLQTNGTTAAVTIDTSQNVGIGTASPTAILQVNSTAAIVRPIVTATTGYTDWVVANTGGNIYFGIDNSAGGVSGTAYGRHIYSDGVYPLDFFTNSTQQMRIDSSGNVGIGTASPNALLNVNGQVQINNVVENSPLGSITNFYLRRTTNDSRFCIGYTSANDAWNLTASYGSTGAYKPLVLATSDTERMRIDSAGNVLVSTNTLYGYQPAPTAKAAAATLTGAELVTGILNTTGTSYTITLPTGTNIDAAVSTSLAANGSFDWYVINTASGTVTIGANGNTTLGTLTVATGVSAQFRFRKTAANTYTVYRLG